MAETGHSQKKRSSRKLLPSLPAPVHGNLVILRACKYSEKVEAIGKSLGHPYQKPSINPTPNQWPQAFAGTTLASSSSGPSGVTGVSTRGGGGPYFYQILQYICPRIPGQFSISRLTARTKRVAAKSIAAIPAESILFIGVAVITADTGYELYAACETVRDLDQLYSDLGVADETQDDVMHSVCVPELPVLWAP
jgi:hypothetical protein